MVENEQTPEQWEARLYTCDELMALLSGEKIKSIRIPLEGKLINGYTYEPGKKTPQMYAETAADVMLFNQAFNAVSRALPNRAEVIQKIATCLGKNPLDLQEEINRRLDLDIQKGG